MKSIKIYPIPLFRADAKFEKSKLMYLVNFGQDLTIYYCVWFIEGAAEKIVIDAGATVEMALTHGRTREQLTNIQSLEGGLAKLKLKPDDIDMVILTHLHWDHVGLTRQFVNARFVVQEDELNFARKPHAAVQQLGVYDQDLFEGLNFEVVNGDCQITDGIKVLLTPGHTVGGQSVAMETEKGIAVLTGFCCIGENFEPSETIRKNIPIVAPGILVNLMQAYDSMLKVKKAADIIIPNHEPKFATMDRIP